jgi:hypothetical protein
MPRSKNRRYLEIPTTLYAELEGQAVAEQRPVSAIVADLVTDGRTVREYLVPMQTELREIRREIEALRMAILQLALPEPAPGLDRGDDSSSKPKRPWRPALADLAPSGRQAGRSPTR